jgi:hypothetical protein
MLQDKRKQSRARCRLAAEIHVRDRCISGHIVDLSPGGLCLSVSQYAEIGTGDYVDIRCEEIGLLQGVTRWRSINKVGVALNPSTNTSAKLSSYFSRRRR